ncbi:MAG: hypothetical protein HY558_00965 [Euryarchaeota archaeon]|nr:hypothetical protein [Euryarchaeota archaeon]
MAEILPQDHREPEADWETTVQDLRQRKAREPGVNYILTDEENTTWRV